MSYHLNLQASDPDTGGLGQYVHISIGISVLMTIVMRTPIPIKRAQSDAYIIRALRPEDAPAEKVHGVTQAFIY